MRTRRLSNRIALIAGLTATAALVSTGTAVQTDRVEAASSRTTGANRSQYTVRPVKPVKLDRRSTTTTVVSTTLAPVTTSPITATTITATTTTNTINTTVSTTANTVPLTVPVTTVVPSSTAVPTTPPPATTVLPTVATTLPPAPTTLPTTVATTPPPATTTLVTTPPTVTTVPSAVAALSLEFLPSAATADWRMELSDNRQSMTNDGTRVTCSVGGFDASTHYGRIRRRLPETDNFAPRGPFTISAGIELPGDFYTQSESYVRFITTDNYPGTMRGSGEKVGSSSGDEWRVGFLIYGSDQLPRLVSEHENRETMVLWKGDSRLPTGASNIEVQFTPSQGNDGAFQISINGEVVAAVSGVRTVPTTLAPDEVVVTRAGTCLDGASKQDTKRLTMHVTSFSFAAQW